MQEQINAAFAAIDARAHANAREFFFNKIDTCRAAVEAARAEHFANGGKAFRFDYTAAAFEHFGSRAAHDLVMGRSRDDAAERIEKHVEQKIAKRNAQIIKALTKAGIEEIPAFELVEISDGFEGVFYVGVARVTIRTILAGGYNIQRLHNRTVVNIKATK
ncbi:MAG: hypothetical protein HWE26_13605 [Alteromonadaceae bacterium]|nr:hypothetical protein [Alteromonadaceae bacterium]